MVSASVTAASGLQWLAGTSKEGPKDKHEAAAMFVHAVMLQHGFRPASAPPPETGAEYVPEQKMPQDWDKSGFGGMYKHHQSGLTFELRMVPLGGRLLVSGTVLEQDDKTYSLDLRLDKYVKDDVKFGTADFSWDSNFKNVEDMASLVQLELAYKMVPDSAKTIAGEATTDTSNAQSSTRTQTTRVGPRMERDPLMIGEPQRPMYPGHPLAVGDEDLMPSGLFPGAGIGPAMPGLRGPGGTLVGPDHPLFAQRRDPDGGIGGPRLPPGAVPPGARFDPFGPPGMFPSRGGNNGAYGPDPDHDRPPPDMYW